MGLAASGRHFYFGGEKADPHFVRDDRVGHPCEVMGCVIGLVGGVGVWAFGVSGRKVKNGGRGWRFRAGRLGRSGLRPYMRLVATDVVMRGMTRV